MYYSPSAGSEPDGSDVAPVVKSELKSQDDFLPLTKCLDLIALVINKSSQSTIVVDALDECEDYDDLLAKLISI